MTSTPKVAALSFLLLLAFVAGTLVSNRSTRAQPESSRRVLYWHDPMHPEYRSDKPGIAPDCGMQLEPVYADGQAAAATPRDLPPGAVHIPDEKQQVIGVRVSAVERTADREEVRTVGRVTVDERRVFRIAAATSGWIVETEPNSVGSVVQKDEPLATFYAREFLGAQQSYLYALDARDRFKAQNASEAQMASTNTQLQSAVDTLQALGMSASQIDGMSRTREKVTTIQIRSPATGFIVSRNVSRGQRFDVGTELFVIADLRRVWVLADMFQYEANFIRAGQTIRLSLPHQGRQFVGRVSEVLPQFDPSTRTLKVRIEVDNPDYALRPDMFVDVQFPLDLPPALTVPSDAVIDSGLRKTVFVDLGNGYFEPRRVETGWRFGDRVQIVRGLMAGEQVVTSGNFLIDSESRMKAAAAGIRGEPERDVVCGMDVDAARAKAAGRTSVRDGKTRYFCSDSCKKQFDANPSKFMAGS
jgi:RND family efflux transporter MFP subunit